MNTLLLVWFLTVLRFCNALVVSPTKPSEDLFYSVPANISDYSEGDIIDWRVAPLMVRAVYYAINVKNVWQFLVRTIDQLGNATAIVTTVLEPYDADPEKILSYQFAQDSPQVDCAPSYSILFGASMDTLEIQLEMYLLATGLSKGWYVVTPDHEGVTNGFTVGKQSGQAALDSIRAVLASKDITGVSPDAKVALWGYSGGTVPSAWAAQMQPTYAPELSNNLVGVATGGLVVNITLTAEATDGTLFAGLIPLCIESIFQVYPEIGELFKEVVTSLEKYSLFMEVQEMCLVPGIVNYAFTEFFGGDDPYFSDGWDFLLRSEVQSVILENTLALEESGGVPEVPMFIYHAYSDEVVPFLGAQQAYDNYCSWGVNSLEFSVSNSTGHALELVEGSGAALKWISDRLDGNGTATVTGCQQTFRESNLDYPGADLSFYQIFRSALEGVTGSEIGAEAESLATAPAEASELYTVLSDIIDSFGTIPLKKRDLPAELQQFKK